MKSIVKSAAIFGLFLVFLVSLDPSIQGSEKKADGNKRMASINGVAITEAQVRSEAAADLEALELQMLRAKAAYERKQYEVLKDSMQRILEEKLLEAEAAKQNISKEQLISREIRQKVIEPTTKDIDLFYEANKNRINKSKEETAAQIGKYLRQQKETEARNIFLSRLEKEYSVVRFLEPLRFDLKVSGRPAKGPESAPVVLMLFSDFQCPYCKSFNETLDKVLNKYGNKVRLIFRQFPLTSIHPEAQKAAEASLCADSQRRFWEMHDLLFQNQGNLKEENLKAQAKKLGLNSEAFNACLASSRYSNYVKEDIRAGSSAGTEGTPTLYINGRHLSEGRSFEVITSIIDEELAKKR